MSSGLLRQSVESSFTQPADVLNIDGRLHKNATISLLLTATFRQNIQLTWYTTCEISRFNWQDLNGFHQIPQIQETAEDCWRSFFSDLIF